VFFHFFSNQFFVVRTNVRMRFDNHHTSFENDEGFVDTVSYVKPMLFDENELSSSEVERALPF